MDPVIPAPAYGDTRIAMGTKSLNGTLLGLMLGLINLVLVWQLVAQLGLSLLAVLIASLVAGAIQGNMLRPYTRPAVLWLASTSIGWLLGYIVIGQPNPLSGPFQMMPATAPLLFGLISSGFQWLLLRRSVGRAACWIWLNAVCWYLIWILWYAFAG
jgi:hypothetical protein